MKIIYGYIQLPFLRIDKLIYNIGNQYEWHWGWNKYLNIKKTSIPESKIYDAVILANWYHRDQKRDDDKPYYKHLENVFDLLKKIGADTETKIAGILHDILEDTNCTETEIEHKFGYRVLSLVKQVTKNPVSKEFNIRTDKAWLIKLCDIVDNCTDMKTWDEKRIRKYLKKKREILELL